MVDTEIWDFRSAVPTKHLKFLHHKCVGDICICRCNIAACSGLNIGTARPCIVVHEGNPFLLQYYTVQRKHLIKIHYGHIHVSNAYSIAELQWPTSQKILVVEMGQEFIKNNLTSAFSEEIPHLPSRLAIRNDCLLEKLLHIGKVTLTSSPHSDLCIQMLGTSIIFEIYNLLGKTKQRKPLMQRGGLGTHRKSYIKIYIEQHLTEDIRIANLANIANLSTDHFRRAFKQSFGLPPWKYIIERRINIAKQMLLKRELSITCIALKLQFSSHAHFTETFRQITGISPSMFRKINKK
ncbi:AraC family transcriptional regulator [Thalassospiraceae bacterium SW-3-3]|nr:AraC family transcriptional regulator [Thalassospiraceae bacterium SW-3-3]